MMDVKSMPDYNPEIKNGNDSVSSGHIVLKQYNGKMYPACINHGALLKVSQDGIWRCGTCNKGCYTTGQIK